MKTEITEKEWKVIELESEKELDYTLNVKESFKRGADFALSELRKPSEEIDTSLKSIIDKMSLECNETLDFMKEQRSEFCNSSEESQEMYMHGFAEALDYCNSMIAELRKPELDYGIDLADPNSRDVSVEVYISELRKPSESEPLGRTDEELVQKIEDIMYKNAAPLPASGLQIIFLDSVNKIATEIAKLIPSSRCQENDENNQAITNAEKQMSYE